MKPPTGTFRVDCQARLISGRKHGCWAPAWPRASGLLDTMQTLVAEVTLFEPLVKFRALEAAAQQDESFINHSVQNNMVKLQKRLTADSLPALLSQVAASSIEELDLSRNPCFIGLSRDDRTQMIASLAQTGGSLSTISLRGLMLTDTSVPAVAQLLTSAHPLRYLNLADNDFHEHGVMRIAAAAKGHKTLVELSVMGQRQNISASAVHALCDAWDATEPLVNLRVGTIRDTTARIRFELLQSQALERRRSRRASTLLREASTAAAEAAKEAADAKAAKQVVAEIAAAAAAAKAAHQAAAVKAAEEEAAAVSVRNEAAAAKEQAKVETATAAAAKETAAADEAAAVAAKIRADAETRAARIKSRRATSETSPSRRGSSEAQIVTPQTAGLTRTAARPRMDTPSSTVSTPAKPAHLDDVPSPWRLAATDLLEKLDGVQRRLDAALLPTSSLAPAPALLMSLPPPPSPKRAAGAASSTLSLVPLSAPEAAVQLAAAWFSESAQAKALPAMSAGTHSPTSVTQGTSAEALTQSMGRLQEANALDFQSLNDAVGDVRNSDEKTLSRLVEHFETLRQQVSVQSDEHEAARAWLAYHM